MKHALEGTEEDGAMEEAQTPACPAQMSGTNASRNTQMKGRRKRRGTEMMMRLWKG